MGKQSITWIGHGSWKFVTCNGTKIYVDPWITTNPSVKVTLEDCMDADIVCVTHGHDDHIGDSIELAKKSGAVFVSLPDITVYASHYGIPADDRGGAVHIGGSIRELDCRIRAVQALHTSDIWGYEYLDHRELIAGSGCCGYVIEPDGGESVYFAGDTGIFGDMKLISDLYKPTVSILPIGDKYVMGPNEAAYAAQLLDTKYIIPGHYNTFPPIVQDAQKFKELVEARCAHSKCVVLEPNETFEF